MRHGTGATQFTAQNNTARGNKVALPGEAVRVGSSVHAAGAEIQAVEPGAEKAVSCLSYVAIDTQNPFPPLTVAFYPCPGLC